MVSHNFGEVIRKARRRLNLTQHQLAERIGVSNPFIGHLESSKRRPSDQTLRRLADVLGLEYAELFLNSHPEAAGLLRRRSPARAFSAWDEFRQGYRMHVDPQEIEMLAKVASMGQVRSPADFLYILNSVRHVLGRELIDLPVERTDQSSPDVESSPAAKSSRAPFGKGVARRGRHPQLH
jgi:transcriptional regulator with XRE-family HTH domain